MDYSPKLRMAMEEMKAILNKHDIAGLIVLHTPGFGEHLLKLDPSYSSIKPETALNEKGVLQKGLRLKVNTETHPNKDDATKAISDSVNMIDILAELSARRIENLFNLSDTIEEALHKSGFEIERDDPTHTDGRQLDN